MEDLLKQGGVRPHAWPQKALLLRTLLRELRNRTCALEQCPRTGFLLRVVRTGYIQMKWQQQEEVSFEDDDEKDSDDDLDDRIWKRDAPLNEKRNPFGEHTRMGVTQIIQESPEKARYRGDLNCFELRQDCGTYPGLEVAYRAQQLGVHQLADATEKVRGSLVLSQMNATQSVGDKGKQRGSMFGVIQAPRQGTRDLNRSPIAWQAS